MRKYLLLIVLGGLFVLLFTSSVYAKNGPHTGPGFIADTGACAGCHRTHTGSAARLLFQGSTRYTFCTFCHNGTGAQTNVDTGEFEGYSNSPLPAGKRTTTYDGHNSQLDGVAGDGLNGGGFISAVPYTGRSGRIGAPVALTVGSEDAQRHDVTGGDTVIKAAWGGKNALGNGPSQDIANFTCTSCHDPHGTNNGDAGVNDGTERYRILRGGTTDSPVNGIGNLPDITSNEAARFPDPLPLDPTNDYKQKDYTSDSYNAGMADLCVACHTQYKTAMANFATGPTAPSDLYDAGDGQGAANRIRHAIDVALGTSGAAVGIRGQGTDVWSNMVTYGKPLPVEQPLGYTAAVSGTDEITCLTCHQSHGTAEVMDDGAVGIAPAGSATVNSSQLLRLKNRGVCQDCHNK